MTTTLQRPSTMDRPPAPPRADPPAWARLAATPALALLSPLGVRNAWAQLRHATRRVG